MYNHTQHPGCDCETSNRKSLQRTQAGPDNQSLLPAGSPIRSGDCQTHFHASHRHNQQNISMNSSASRSLLLLGIGLIVVQTQAEEFRWQVRVQKSSDVSQNFERTVHDETWPASKTAFIVCDVWDKHHCLNAVRRLEEFGPRLNAVLAEARTQGAIIIHSPSDCMPAYEVHPARTRAIAAPKAIPQPQGIANWCSRIPAEEQAAYPIDQSDGGEDDDPEEHARWAAELKALGRNPNMPWKSQSSMITIDSERDYVSDRGDEVWNILQHHDIEHVVLTGVHTNMCVLGRPFGLRQMVRNSMNVVLMRDMTDCMYNPERWPFVDHFTGNDLIISHVERFVCPTLTSDQIIGGSPFRFSGDKRTEVDVTSVSTRRLDMEALRNQWSVVPIPARWEDLTDGRIKAVSETVWYRATLLASEQFLSAENADLSLVVTPPAAPGTLQVWVNGQELSGMSFTGISLNDRLPVIFTLPKHNLPPNEAAVLVIRADAPTAESNLLHSDTAPTISCGNTTVSLQGRWQVRLGNNPEWSNLPLPAKFGTATDIVFELTADQP